MRKRAAVTGAALILMTAASLALHGQGATFSSKIEVVRVDALVTSQGRPVPGLVASDFEILDNGVPQQADIVSFQRLPLNVVLTLDMSNSVEGERLAHLQEAGRALVDALKKGDRSALITFNHVVTMRTDLTADTILVREAIDQATPIGETSVVDASFAGMMLAESDAGRGLVIVFSDGLDTSSWLRPAAVIDVAKRSDVVVYAVAAGLGSNARFLNDLTSQTGGRMFEMASTRNLSGVFLEALNEFRQRYLLSYTPSGVAKEGWHQISVRVKSRRATVKARPGYLAGR